jgi:TolB-like protein
MEAGEYNLCRLPMQPNGIKADPVLEELERILASPGFVRNERLSGFLRFIVEQGLRAKTAELKEIVIGAEVFGRKPGYDTHSDPVVRTEASKLRARLGEYYAGPGADDPIRIEIPKGAYIPQWQFREGARRPRAWRWVVAAVALGLVVAGVVVWRWPRAAAKPAVAVLPFLNLSSDPDNAYFSDGLADEITELLSLTDGLEVIARTSSFALKGTQLDAREIGARLNATLLVEGSVQKSSQRLKVIVQLIRTTDGKHLWSNTYESEMRDVFATEERIAASIASELRLKLRARRRYTDKPEAFELYVRGRNAFDRRSTPLALQYFEQATATDPSYAPAYAGIADAAFMMNMDRKWPSGDAHGRATAAIERALTLDPGLPEVYAALGEIKSWEYALPEAERAFRHAIELNPNNARAHALLGYYVLAPLGRFQEAVREVRNALAHDPLSFETSGFARLTMFMAGLYEETEKEARRAIALDQGLPRGYPALALALSFQGKHAEATKAIRLGKRLVTGQGNDWSLACVSVRAGQRDEALRMLQENLHPPDSAPLMNRRLFAIYACLGEKDKALEYAEKAYAEHDPLLPTFLTYPITAWLRADPAFAALRQRIGMPK